MARGKKKKSNGGGAGIERLIGTALTSVVLAKVALGNHNGSQNGAGKVAVAPGAAAPERREQAPLRLAENEAGHGRGADSPTDIPAAGWKDILWRATKQVKSDGVPLLSGGVAYYALLALFPALIAL